MADFLSLISSIPALMQAFGGGTTDPYRQQQEALASQQAQYAQAAANPNSDIYKGIYNKYQNQNHMNLASAIAEAQGQNRMNANMGRLPLLSQERGGENLFRAMTQNYQDSSAQSDTQTRAALTSAANIGQQAQTQYKDISPFAQSANSAQLSGFNMINNMLKPQVNTGSMGGGNYSQNINWNTPRLDPRMFYS